MNSKIKVFLKLYLTFKYKIITFIAGKCEYKLDPSYGLKRLYLVSFWNYKINEYF